MAEISRIEEILRKRSEKKCLEEIKREVNDQNRVITGSWLSDIFILLENKTYRATELISLIQDKLFLNGKERYYNDEVDTFVREVGELKEQLDQI